MFFGNGVSQMSWNYEKSRARLKDEWRRINEAGVTVKPLTREMDLSNLSPTDARLVTGVHLYADTQTWMRSCKTRCSDAMTTGAYIARFTSPAENSGVSYNPCSAAIKSKSKEEN